MKKLVLSLIITLVSLSVHAEDFKSAAKIVTEQPIVINRQLVGSGAQTGVGKQTSIIVHRQGLLHTPNYMPGYPTATTLWPRVVRVPCVKGVDGKLYCDQFDWTPADGRGEYIYYTPMVKEPAYCPPSPPVVVYKEVPVKKKKE